MHWEDNTWEITHVVTQTKAHSSCLSHQVITLLRSENQNKSFSHQGQSTKGERSKELIRIATTLLLHTYKHWLKFPLPNLSVAQAYR